MLKPAFWGRNYTGKDDRTGKNAKGTRCIGLKKALRLMYWFRAAAAFGLFGSFLAVLIHMAEEYDMSLIPKGSYTFLDPSVYTSFSFILGFVLTFRTNQAYQRYWEGATLLEQMMGNWYDAASNLVAFCHNSKEDRDKIQQFQHVLARLLSLINAVILCELAGQELEPEALKYNLLDATGLDKVTLRLITRSECRPELIFQKIQTLVVANMANGVLNVPPPILTRAFQQMSNAMLNFHDATKLRVVPFPAHYIAVAYMLTIAHIFLSPIIALNWTYTVWQAAFVSFVQVFMVVALLTLANGLDNPFDSRSTNLELEAVHTQFNRRMTCLVGEWSDMTVPSLNKKTMALGSSNSSDSKLLMQGSPPGTCSSDGVRHTLQELYKRFNTDTSLESSLPPPSPSGGERTVTIDEDYVSEIPPVNSVNSGQGNRPPPRGSVQSGMSGIAPAGMMRAVSGNRPVSEGRGRPKLDRGGGGSNLTLPSLASPRWSPGKKIRRWDPENDDSDEENNQPSTVSLPPTSTMPSVVVVSQVGGFEVDAAHIAQESSAALQQQPFHSLHSNEVPSESVAAVPPKGRRRLGDPELPPIHSNNRPSLSSGKSSPTERTGVPIPDKDPQSPTPVLGPQWAV